MTTQPAIRAQRHGIDHRTISLCLPGATDAALRELARRRGLSISRVATQAIQIYLKLQESGYDDEEGAA
jgi:predicted transcriptional regulator